MKYDKIYQAIMSENALGGLGNRLARELDLDDGAIGASYRDDSIEGRIINMISGIGWTPENQIIEDLEGDFDPNDVRRAINKLLSAKVLKIAGGDQPEGDVDFGEEEGEWWGSGEDSEISSEPVSSEEMPTGMKASFQDYKKATSPDRKSGIDFG